MDKQTRNNKKSQVKNYAYWQPSTLVAGAKVNGQLIISLTNDDNQQRQTSVEAENAALRKRLAIYEREATEAPKNAAPPSEEGASTSTKATNQEILDYLTATMRNLEGFKRQLLN